MIHESTTYGVTILRLAHGKASALDLELTEALAAKLEALGSGGVSALVLTGTGSIFSAGVDLYRLVDGGRDYVSRFLPALDRMFRALFMFPAPVIAAVNGHAIAGGCIIACASDRRLMADGDGRIGVPELKVGVPFPPLVVEIVRNAIAPPHLDELLYVGRTYAPREALVRGIVDDLVPPDRLVDRAVDAASELAAAPRTSFNLTKRAIRLPCLERARQTEAADGRALLAAWSSDDTYAAVRAYIAKTLRTRS
jgi:enoyl-CoA hydratase/carnithine racemase